MIDPKLSGTIAEFVPALAAAYGDRVAVVLEHDTLSFRQLEAESARLARGLLARGVGKGSRVGMLFGNGPSFAITWGAISRIGAVCVPLSTFAAPREVARVIRHADLHALIAPRTFLEQDIAHRLEAAFPTLATARDADILMTDAPFLRWVAFLGDEPAPVWAHDGAWLTAAGASLPNGLLEAAEHEVHRDDEAIAIYTSGQSAAPKGVVHTHGSVMTKVHYLRHMMAFDESTIEHASMPFFWVGGLVMHLLTTLETGARVVCTDRSTFGSSRVIGSSARRDASDSLIENMRLAPSLGMTETFGMYSWGNDWSAARSTIASPLDVFQPGFDVKVVDRSGNEVADGQRGEILVRGPCVASRLHKVDRPTVFDADGFYRTGDEGEVEGARIHFTGRLGDLIKTSGASVSPAEVEQALLGFDDIEFAAVVPIADDQRGQLVAAAVVPVAGCEVRPHELRERLRTELSSYKIPRTFVVFASRDEIPMTPSMKVRKQDLADLIASRRPNE